MKDENHISFSGDGKGAIYGPNGGLLFTADIPGMREVRLGVIAKPKGRPIADLLKLSGCVRLSLIVESLDARGCSEDAIDINHCTECAVVVDDLWAASKYCGTIKGGSKRISLVVHRQHNHGGEVDWDYGNFADQGNGRTTGCTLQTTLVDGTTARVRLLSADPVQYINEPAQRYATTKLNQGWFYPLFNALKDALALFGIKI